jgi:HEAT repeat protein
MPDPVALIAQLQSRSPKIRQQAAEQLGDLHVASALEPLIERLRDRIDYVQVAAATALGQLGDARAVAPLIKSFHGETYGLTDGEGSPGQYFMIVASAAQALGRIGTPAAVDALLARLALDNPLNDEGTAAAADGLGYVQEPRVLPALVNALGSPSFFVRDYAASALGRLAAPDAVEPLIQALRDRSWTVQLSAAVALGTIGDVRAAAPLQAVLAHIETYVPKAAVYPPFLNDVRVHLRAKAARGLALIGTPNTLDLLEGMFRSTMRETQLIAAFGLAYRKDPRVFEVLAEALEDKVSGIQIEAIEGLGALGDVRAEPLLDAVAHNRHVWTRVNDVARQTLKDMRRARSNDFAES